MDSNNPKEKPAQLLSDLESIRKLLEPSLAEPPLLTDSIDPLSIPLLSDIVPPAFAAHPLQPIPPSAAVSASSHTAADSQAMRLIRLEEELRLAAQLVLQEIIDDFVPQIEAELNNRLQERLEQLIKQKKTPD